MTGAPVRPRQPWTGRHVIITGGSSGIGLATAHAAAQRGAHVSLLARGAARLSAACEEIAAAGGSVRSYPADVTKHDAVTFAIAAAVARSGPCDLLVTSAGIANPGYFAMLNDRDFRHQMEVNYFGTLWAIRAVSTAMATRGSGSIVAVSSVAGLVGLFGYSAYGPTKYAVRGLAESLRAELAPTGVHVACVCPPDVDTPQLAYENARKPPETVAVAGGRAALAPAKVADAIMAGVDRRTFWITPGVDATALAWAGSVLWRPLQRVFDRRAARASAAT